MPVFSRLGPALAPLFCALLVLGLVVFAVLVPIGRPSRTLDTTSAVGMTLGAAALAIWAVALGVQAWWLSGVERQGVILTPSMSPGVFDVLLSAPFLVVVPVAAGGLYPMFRGGAASAPALLCAVFCAGLCALREADGQGYVRAGSVTARKGWLWVRRDSLPVGEVRGVIVKRDSYRGAPSYVVKLDVDAPGLAALEARYRDVTEAEAEAARWRAALGSLQGAP